MFQTLSRIEAKSVQKVDVERKLLFNVLKYPCELVDIRSFKFFWLYTVNH